MGRKYYKRSSRPKTKYSVEQSAFTEAVTASNQSATLIVAPTAVQGMRKVKHLTVTLASQGSVAAAQDVYWALVYCPEGMNPNQLTVSSVVGQSTPLYEPNQYVMSCGVMDFSAGPTRVSTPLSRNLNSGDRIFLIMANPTANTINLYGVVRYAISLH